ncbi:hypothetical protein Q8G35_28245 [Peribacillus simplex]|uniref:Uncharacterized protein n=2 Tax=Peribacillus TaxID=2675229 RepID=A0AA90PFC7_9BACI|nr:MULTISPECIES: hypothetical protein [Peribacillus]MDP1422137.1 hypothetical protein [Peribacillus simplex]MDP1454788.1 hypothetical protein [Peribacillus frigoritolerans]
MLIAGRIKNFKDYSKFSSIKEFKNTIEMLLAEQRRILPKGNKSRSNAWSVSPQNMLVWPTQRLGI